MGIKDLLKSLEGATVQQNLSDFRGKRLAIDASGWLHKAVFTIAEDWVDSNCTDSQLYVDVIITRLKQLQNHDIVPVMVFDGKRNALKSETNAKREEGRISNMDNARRLLESISKTTDAVCRNKMRSECIACLQRGLGATHEMEKNLLAALRKYSIDTIVAPYEADPQLAYLCHIGYCDGVLSEDSDILVYSAVSGVAFPVLCKYDHKSGAVQTVDLRRCGILGDGPACGSKSGSSDGYAPDGGIESLEEACFAVGVADKASAPAKDSTSGGGSGGRRKAGGGQGRTNGGGGGFLSQLQAHFRPSPPGGVSHPSSSSAGKGQETNIPGRRMFVQLCLLAGCDYSDSIPGVGLQTALQAVIRFKDTTNDLRLRKICDFFKLSGKTVADAYLPRILRAEQLFFYHPVFNPLTDSVEHFTSPSDPSELVWAPEVSAAELARLGGEAREVLSLAKRDSSPGGRQQVSLQQRTGPDDQSLTVVDVCRGHYSIKDHSAIMPRYPWEMLQNGRLVTLPADGKTTGWYMRRTLMNALKEHQARSLYYGAAKVTSSSSSSTGHSSAGSVLVSTFMLPKPDAARSATVPSAVPSAVPTSSSTRSQPTAQEQPQRSVVTSSYFRSTSAHTVVSSNHLEHTSKTHISHSMHQFAAFELLAAPAQRRAMQSAPRHGQSAHSGAGVYQVDSGEMDTVYDLVEDSNNGADVYEVPGQIGGSNAEPETSAMAVDPDPEVSAAPTVYDVVDSPPLASAKKSKPFTAFAMAEHGSASRLTDLTGDSPVKRSNGPAATPPVAGGHNPFSAFSAHSAAGSVVSTAKKPTVPKVALVTPAQEGPGGGSGGTTASGAAVHRKTLGSAPFLPIPRPPLDAAFAQYAASSHGTSNEASTAAKRKLAPTAQGVQVPRKKINGRAQAGSITVASIKSFFSSTS